MNAEQKQQEIAEQLDELNAGLDFIGLCIAQSSDINTLKILGETAGEHKRLIEDLQLKNNWIERIDQKPIEFEAKV